MPIRPGAGNFAAMLVRRSAGRFVRRLARPIARILGVPTQAQLKATEDRAEARIHDLEDQVLQLVGRQTRLASDITTLVTRLTDLGTLHQVAPLSRWLDHVQLDDHPLISVITPTYERVGVLPRAIFSVIGQRYPHWELLVVDDGGVEDSHRVVEAFGDDRIHWMRVEHAGVCAARNAGLRAARGSIVAYLDDDNVMDPGWLQAVAWAFQHRPDVDVLYGAFVIDDLLRVNGDGSGALPELFLHPWNRDALQRGNLADISAIAHRAGLPGAEFDPSLREMGDWDLLLSLTRETEPLVLPAVACYYTTTAQRRLSGGPTYAADRARVTARATSRL